MPGRFGTLLGLNTAGIAYTPGPTDQARPASGWACSATERAVNPGERGRFLPEFWDTPFAFVA